MSGIRGRASSLSVGPTLALCSAAVALALRRRRVHAVAAVPFPRGAGVARASPRPSLGLLVVSSEPMQPTTEVTSYAAKRPRLDADERPADCTQCAASAPAFRGASSGRESDGVT